MFKCVHVEDVETSNLVFLEVSLALDSFEVSLALDSFVWMCKMLLLTCKMLSFEAIPRLTPREIYIMGASSEECEVRHPLSCAIGSSCRQ